MFLECIVQREEPVFVNSNETHINIEDIEPIIISSDAILSVMKDNYSERAELRIKDGILPYGRFFGRRIVTVKKYSEIMSLLFASCEDD